jgi:uncharacterized protein (TIGR03437 family)
MKHTFMHFSAARGPLFAAFEIAAFMAAMSLPGRAASSGCIAPPSGLVSWWPGDTNNNDIAGPNNPNGASGVSLVPAEVLDGFTLGTNGYLQVAPSQSLANQNFTWAAWVKPLGPGPNNDSDGSALIIQDIDDYDLSVAFYWTAMGNKFIFIFGNIDSEVITSNDSFPAGSFYFVAGTFDGTTFRLYVNGVLEGSMSDPKTVQYSTNPWSFASSGQIGISVGYPRTLNGILDEVQAFNRPLSQSELQSIYAAGSAGECKGNFQPGPPVPTGPFTALGGIVNAGSYANPILPSSGIAQGSLFTIFGSNLGPASSPSLAFPLSDTLGGVSIVVSEGSETVSAIPVFVSGSQVNAIMPSTAPLGTVTVYVTYNGQTSSGTAQVVPASFGIFTVNSAGSGAGIITESSYSIIGYNASAHPGDTLIIWGTGLGAISTGDANPPPVGNVGSTPPPVYVGGTEVTPSYYGRSGCCSGLDQIVFQVPNVTGCSVPVAVQTAGGTSNFVSLAIAPTGSNTCTDPNGLTASQLTTFAANGAASIGSIVYQTYNDTSPGFNLLGGGTEVSTGTQEIGAFEKYQFTNLTSIAPALNAGACTVYSFTGTSPIAPGVVGAVGLDAGSAITITDGNEKGQMSESSSNKGSYSAPYLLPSGSATFTAPGGANVGNFSVVLPIASESLNWTNENSIGTITRSKGVQVTWSGADPNGTVQITGYSVGGSSSSSAAGAGFTCTAPGSANQFTVPPSVLQFLPASANFSNSILAIPTGVLGISSTSTPVSFSATGLDIGAATTQSSFNNSTVTYQ